MSVLAPRDAGQLYRLDDLDVLITVRQDARHVAFFDMLKRVP